MKTLFGTIFNHAFNSSASKHKTIIARLLNIR